MFRLLKLFLYGFCFPLETNMKEDELKRVEKLK